MTISVFRLAQAEDEDQCLHKLQPTKQRGGDEGGDACYGYGDGAVFS